VRQTQNAASKSNEQQDGNEELMNENLLPPPQHEDEPTVDVGIIDDGDPVDGEWTWQAYLDEYPEDLKKEGTNEEKAL
jgi:hypothetical protein